MGKKSNQLIITSPNRGVPPKTTGSSITPACSISARTSKVHPGCDASIHPLTKPISRSTPPSSSIPTPNSDLIVRERAPPGICTAEKQIVMQSAACGADGGDDDDGDDMPPALLAARSAKSSAAVNNLPPPVVPADIVAAWDPEVDRRETNEAAAAMMEKALAAKERKRKEAEDAHRKADFAKRSDGRGLKK